MFTIDLGTEFHMPNATGSLVTAIKQRAKYHTYFMGLRTYCFTLYKAKALNRIYIFVEDLLPYIVDLRQICKSC
jgi:hypothetical protein